MTELSSWRPRASSSGYYWACSQRASFDRAVHEGLLPAELKDDGGPKPYAALGTCIHYILQSGMRAKFPGPPKNFAPTQEEWEQAASLFGGDMAAMKKSAEASARAALAHVPKLPDGVHWLAEPTVDGGEYCPPGHIDLIASDMSILCDLKTTRIKPKRMKRAALIQLGAYCLATGARKVRAIYVDSMSASWAVPFDADFSDEGKDALILEKLPELVKYWRGPTLHDTAHPGLLDDQCSDDFCPYTSICRDELVPKADSQFTRSAPLPLGGITL